MAYWLFQANPKYYKITDAIQNFEEMLWPVTRYDKRIAIGDKVVIWIAGKTAGIYALAEVTETAHLIKSTEDKSYWLDKSKIVERLQAKIKFTKKLLDKPLLRNNLLNDSVLQRLSVIRGPNGTNFVVTPGEWQRVEELINQNEQ